MPLLPAAGAEPAKEKTIAKQRYLKSKKKRRKNKKSADSSKPNENEDDAEENDEPQKMETGETATPNESKRPKKRLKTSNVESVDVNMEAMNTVDEDAIMQIDEKEIPPSLPSFPLPALPNAPSKTVLALQGLDQALVEAEIVDSSCKISLVDDSDSSPAARLSQKTKQRLKEMGIVELFAVQTSLLPFLLPLSARHKSLYQPYDPPRDVCVSAPTGSGKTLAYVLPIIEVLSPRIVTRLRALIVLPTRDLVIQVRNTFEAVGKGRGLKIATVTGQHSFVHEQNQIIADKSSHYFGGSSKIDILICTPGRLMDHLSGTPNFSLQHLRFLVIDEADRLLAQSFQDWLAQVLAATSSPPQPISLENDEGIYSRSTADALAPSFMKYLPYSDFSTLITEKKQSSCQKLLFSATLTRDPGKLAALDLRNPKYFVVRGSKDGGDAGDGEDGADGVLDVAMDRFAVPDTLQEHLIVCESSMKPLLLFHLVHAKGVTNALVFTKSAESTVRLVNLFNFFENAHAVSQKVVVSSYSSDIGAGERKNILDKFKSGEIHILVCTDLIARGIDIDNVAHVVSYDAPVDMRKYVHRVGRTARAGRTGDAWTLVEEQEARYFKNVLRDADHLSRVKRLRVSQTELEGFTAAYEIALNELKEAYSRS